jgi:hypothetical protein
MNWKVRSPYSATEELFYEIKVLGRKMEILHEIMPAKFALTAGIKM